MLEHLGGTSESVTRFSDRDVEDNLLDAQLPHGVGGLLFCNFSLFARILVNCINGLQVSSIAYHDERCCVVSWLVSERKVDGVVEEKKMERFVISTFCA